jgi:hypothetical protein
MCRNPEFEKQIFDFKMTDQNDVGSHDTMLAPSKNMVLVSQRYNLVVV